MTTDLTRCTAAQLYDLYRKAETSPVEVATAVLDRIEAVNPVLNCFCLVDRDTSLAQARESEARWQAKTPLGPLDGVPVSIKDLTLTAGWPTLRTVWFGLTDALLSVPEPGRFVGLDNYAALAADPEWWRAVRNTAIFVVVSVALETVLGVAFALALDVRFAGRALLRAVVIVPLAVPTVISARIWAWIFHDLHGVLNHMLLGLGVIAAPIAWTADPAFALGAVIAVDVWKTTPFVAILALAALQVVPRELYESARVDGAGAIQIFRLITLPLILPAVAVAVVFRTLDALRVFDSVYVLTGNNPQTATLSIFIRQQLVDFQDVGYGSAAATVVLLAAGLAAVVYVTQRRVRAGVSR